MNFKVEDHTKELKKQMEKQIEVCLDVVGVQAVGDVVRSIESKGLVRSGGAGLAGSISHIVKGDEVHVGSPLEYAVFQENGTGVHAENGSGRKGWWVYVEGSDTKGHNTHKTYSYEEAKKIMAILRSKGLDAHMTQGVRPQHFLKEAIEGNIDQYNRILTEYVKDVLDDYR